MHVAWTLIARILMTINSVAAGIIVARWLGREGYGQLAVINVAIATVIQLGGAGLPSANTYFIAQDRKSFAPAAVNSLIFALVAVAPSYLILLALANIVCRLASGRFFRWVSWRTFAPLVVLLLGCAGFIFYAFTRPNAFVITH